MGAGKDFDSRNSTWLTRGSSMVLRSFTKPSTFLPGGFKQMVKESIVSNIKSSSNIADENCIPNCHEFIMGLLHCSQLFFRKLHVPWYQSESQPTAPLFGRMKKSKRTLQRDRL